MTTPETDPATDRLMRLAEAVAAAVHEYSELAETSGDQFVTLARKAKTNRQLIWAVAISVMLDIALSVVLGLSLIQVVDNDHKISQLTDRLNTSQTVTRRNSLCPLYTLFKASETPAARNAAPDKAAYDHAVAVIQGGYNALSCADFVTTPPTIG